MFLRILAAIAAALWLSASPPVLAAEPSNDTFYAGKTITIIVGSGAGGGYDTNARMIARYLGRYIPGEPNVIVQNMPGAGSLTATMYLYNKAAHDGTMIGMVQRFVMISKILDPALAFESDKFNWLADLTSEAGVTLVSSTAPHMSANDLMKTELIIGGSGVTGENEVMARLYNAAIGTKFKVVSGYPSSTELMLALERGEIQGLTGASWPTIKRSAAFRDGKIRILMQDGLKADPDLKDVPLAINFAKTAEDRQMMEAVLVQKDLGRPMLAPPHTPPERVTILRNAIEKTMKDPDYLAAATEAQLDPDYKSGERVDQIVKKLGALPENLRKRFVSVAEPK